MDTTQLRALLDKASGRPWTAFGCAIEGGFTPTGQHRVGIVMNGMSRPRADHDVALVVAAVNALPALLDIAEKAEAVVADAPVLAGDHATPCCVVKAANITALREALAAGGR